MVFLDRVTRIFSRILICIAGGFLGIMILLTCANVFLRLFSMPVRGTFEFMGYFGAVVTAFALGYTQIKRGHIAVDIVVLGFSKKTRKILNGINYFICMIFFAIVSWQIAKYATTLLKTGEVTETLRIIYYPFAYSVALGCAFLSLVFLNDLLRSFIKSEGGEA